MSADPRFPTGQSNWEGLTFQQIEQMFAKEDDPSVWRQIVGYRETHELLTQQMRGLETARQDLDRLWPSATNTAAKALGQVITDLLGSMRMVSDAAVANMSGLEDVALEVGEARRKIQELRTQWQQNEEQDKKDEVFGVPVKFWVDDPEDDWQGKLHQQAVTRLKAMDDKVGQGLNQMVVPPPYKGLVPPDSPGGLTSDEPTGQGSGGGSGRQAVPGPMTAPVIPTPEPPVTGSVGPGAAGPDSGGAQLAGVVPAGGASNVGTVGGLGGAVGSSNNSGPGVGAVIGAIGGFAGGAIGSVGSGGGSLVGRVGGGLGPAGSGSPTGAGSGLGPRAGGPLAGVIGSSGAPTAGAAGARPGAMTPGGVIGGSRGSGVAGATVGGVGGQRAGGAAVGGVGGQRSGGSTARPGVSTGPDGRPGGAAMATSAAGRGTYTDSDDQHEEFDPDSPWTTLEAGPAVITAPQRAGPHEAGPGVIGARP